MPERISDVKNNPEPKKGFGQREGPSFASAVLDIVEEASRQGYALTLREIKEKVEALDDWSDADITMKKMQGTIHNLKKQKKVVSRQGKAGRTVWFLAE